jgi:dGTP triphosphohydrolase
MRILRIFPRKTAMTPDDPMAFVGEPRLLPSTFGTQEKLGIARTVADYVAGMTDDYATRVYAKLFSPYYGSIFDRL